MKKAFHLSIVTGGTLFHSAGMSVYKHPISFEPLRRVGDGALLFTRELARQALGEASEVGKFRCEWWLREKGAMMAKRSNLILLTISLVLALLATLAILKELPQSKGVSGTLAPPATTSVVVVAKNIPGDTPIDSTDVQVQQVPSAAVEIGAATDVSQVIGKYTASNWMTGQQVVAGMYESPAQANIANSIPAGDRAFTIPSTALTGADFLIIPGDTIDLLFFGAPSAATSTVMSNLLVIYVDHVQAAGGADSLPTSTSGADSVTVAVTPQQAVQLAKLLSTVTLGSDSSAGTMHMLLHSAK